MKLNLKKMMPALCVLAAVLIVVGIVLLAFAAPNASSTFFRVCVILIAAICELLGLCFLYLVYLSRDRDANFFLYDAKTERNIDPESLSVDQISSRMGYFMTTLSASQEELWNQNIFEEANNAKFGMNGIYKPLAAYKMLLDLAEVDTPAAWSYFLAAKPETINGLLDVLEANGERERMVPALSEAYNNATSNDDIDWTRDYIIHNVKYMRRRMSEYVHNNIDSFY